MDLEEFFERILPCQQRNRVYVPCHCPFYAEVKQLSEVYVSHNVFQWSSKNKVVMNFDFFRLEIGMSCLYQEVREAVFKFH